jgi:hypothetical protein
VTGRAWAFAFVLSATTGLNGVNAGAQTPFNDYPLRGVDAYSLVAVVAPGLPQFAGIQSKDLKARAESILQDAGILSSEGRSPVASVFIMVSFTPPKEDLRGWHAAIEVRERARLERAPDSGLVMAVTWTQMATGLSTKHRLAAALESAVNDLVEALVSAHQRGGPATR